MAKTSPKLTTIRLDTKLADEAVSILGVRNRTEAVHAALHEIVRLQKFKKLLTRQGGKLKLEAHGK